MKQVWKGKGDFNAPNQTSTLTLNKQKNPTFKAIQRLKRFCFLQKQHIHNYLMSLVQVMLFEEACDVPVKPMLTHCRCQ